MTVKEFFQTNGIAGKPEVHFADTCYKDATGQLTDTTIQYVRLNKAVAGFNFMTLSLNAVKAKTEDKSAWKKFDVVLDTEYGWKIQMPDTSALCTEEIDW